MILIRLNEKSQWHRNLIKVRETMRNSWSAPFWSFYWILNAVHGRQIATHSKQWTEYKKTRAKRIKSRKQLLPCKEQSTQNLIFQFRVAAAFRCSYAIIAISCSWTNIIFHISHIAYHILHACRIYNCWRKSSFSPKTRCKEWQIIDKTRGNGKK